MRFTSEEGLLLRQREDSGRNSFVYERLGIYVIGKSTSILPKGLLVQDHMGSYVIEDQLPVEKVIFIKDIHLSKYIS